MKFVIENIRYLNDTIYYNFARGVLKSLRYICVRYIRHFSIDLYKNFAGILIRISFSRKFAITVLIIFGFCCGCLTCECFKFRHFANVLVNP